MAKLNDISTFLHIKLKLAIVIIGFLLSSLQLGAQGWERYYEFGIYENGTADDVALTADGGYVMVGTVLLADSSDYGVAVIKVDAEGEEQWSKVYGDAMVEERGRNIIPQADGSYVIAGITYNNAFTKADYWLFKVDAYGDNILWSYTFGLGDADEDLNDVIQSIDGGFVLLGEWSPLTKSHIIKTDADGIEQWNNQVGPDTLFSEGRDIERTSDGGYIISGLTKTAFSGVESDLLFTKVSANGDEEWSTFMGNEFSEQADAVVEASDGGFVAAGFQMEGATTNSDLYLTKVNADGDSLWTKKYGIPVSNERGFTIVRTNDDGYLIGGNSTLGMGSTYLVKTDAQGDTLWTKLFNTNQASGWTVAMHQTSDGGYILAGANEFTLALLKTNELGETYSSYIMGNVFHDVNDNCNFNVGEEGLAGWYVLAKNTNNGDEYVTLTDEVGNYEVTVDTGVYELQVIPANALWESCPETYWNINSLYDTTIVSLAAKSVVDCPHMTVDISTPFLRRCFENTYYINYSNDGTLGESDAIIEVQFDEFLAINSSNIPFTDLGNNLLSFDIGSVGVGESGGFSVNVTVDCDSTVLGQTHCVEAHIFPDTSCLIPSPIWDGSEIEVSGECMGDSVLFEIRNVGTGAMVEPAVTQIIIDDVIILLGLINLGIGEADSIVTYPNGKTVRLEAIQSNGYPGMSMPTAVVEGCGANISNISTGFVTQFPMDDVDSFIDVDCQQNQGAVDPNLKRPYPNGYFDENFISADDEIEYHIKFQNTGTDTAINVVIKDTISEFLNPVTVWVGASSHPYTYSIDENGTLKFTFENIMLPDSNVNEAASHGYVKFNIKQRPDNLPGTVINNEAAIYFDFNEPVITENVFLTIEKPSVFGVDEDAVCEGEPWRETYYFEEDTVVVDSFPMVTVDSFHLTYVDILEISNSKEDVILNIGDLYQDTLYLSDTTLYRVYEAYNGCDSLVTVQIILDDDFIPSPIHSFDVFPNPALDQFKIEYNLYESQNIRLTICDALGREIKVLADNENQKTGNYEYIINVREQATSVWFVHFQSKRGRTVQKIIVGNSF